MQDRPLRLTQDLRWFGVRQIENDIGQQSTMKFLVGTVQRDLKPTTVSQDEAHLRCNPRLPVLSTIAPQRMPWASIF